MDLRDDLDTIKQLAEVNKEPLNVEDGLNMAIRINAYAYLECSAKTKDGVKEVYETAKKAAFQHKKKRKKLCVLL